MTRVPRVAGLAAILGMVALLTPCGCKSPADGALRRDDTGALPDASNGVIWLTSNQFTTMATAAIGDFDSAPCEVPVASAGSCTFFHACDPTPTWHPLGAGTITVSSSQFSLVFQPSQDKSYPGATAGHTWGSGDTVTIVAAGNEVPAFEVDIPAPAPLDVTGFDFAAGIDRQQGTEIHWTPRAGLDLRFELHAYTKGLTRLIDFLECDFPSESGLGQVPGGLLSNFNQSQLMLLSESRAARVIQPGGFEIDVWLDSPVLTSGGPAHFAGAVSLR